MLRASELCAIGLRAVELCQRATKLRSVIVLRAVERCTIKLLWWLAAVIHVYESARRWAAAHCDSAWQ